MNYPMVSLLTFVADAVDSVIVGGENSGGGSAASNVLETASDAISTSAGAVPEAGALGLLPMIVIYGGVIFAFYWFFMRPQKKREKEIANMQKSIRVGDNVVTSAGLYGKVTDVGEDAFIVEFGTNRGVRIPVRKSDIIGIGTPKMTPPPAIPENTEKK